MRGRFLRVLAVLAAFSFAPWGVPFYDQLGEADYAAVRVAPEAAAARPAAFVELRTPARSPAWEWYDRPAPIGGRFGGFLEVETPYRVAGPWTLEETSRVSMPDGSYQGWAVQVPGVRWLAVLLPDGVLGWVHTFESWAPGWEGLPALEATPRPRGTPYPSRFLGTQRNHAVRVREGGSLYARLDDGLREAPGNIVAVEEDGRVGVIGALRRGRDEPRWLLVEYGQRLLWAADPGFFDRALRGWGPLLHAAFGNREARFRSCLPVVLFPPSSWSRCDAGMDGRMADRFERGYDRLDPVYGRMAAE